MVLANKLNERGTGNAGGDVSTVLVADVAILGVG